MSRTISSPSPKSRTPASWKRRRCCVMSRLTVAKIGNEPSGRPTAADEGVVMDSQLLAQHGNQTRHTHVADGRPGGFFTDPTVCIGCKACEVACKEWNDVPEDGLVWSGNSYDNSHSLGASTWRHVKFLELDRRLGAQVAGPMTAES